MTLQGDSKVEIDLLRDNYKAQKDDLKTLRSSAMSLTSLSPFIVAPFAWLASIKQMNMDSILALVLALSLIGIAILRVLASVVSRMIIAKYNINNSIDEINNIMGRKKILISREIYLTEPDFYMIWMTVPSIVFFLAVPAIISSLYNYVGLLLYWLTGALFILSIYPIIRPILEARKHVRSLGNLNHPASEPTPVEGNL